MVNNEDAYRRWHLVPVSYMDFYWILSSGVFIIASLLSTCAHTYSLTPTHTMSLSAYWFICLSLSICLYTPISWMLLTLARNHGTDATSNEQLQLKLTLQEETPCWRPSWSALLMGYFPFKKTVFCSAKKVCLHLLQLTTCTYETAMNISPTFSLFCFYFMMLYTVASLFSLDIPFLVCIVLSHSNKKQISFIMRRWE